MCACRRLLAIPLCIAVASPALAVDPPRVRKADALYQELLRDLEQDPARIEAPLPSAELRQFKGVYGFTETASGESVLYSDAIGLVVETSTTFYGDIKVTIQSAPDACVDVTWKVFYTGQDKGGADTTPHPHLFKRALYDVTCRCKTSGEKKRRAVNFTRDDQLMFDCQLPVEP